jgi:hypothetical protein
MFIFMFMFHEHGHGLGHGDRHGMDTDMDKDMWPWIRTAGVDMYMHHANEATLSSREGIPIVPLGLSF